MPGPTRSPRRKAEGRETEPVQALVPADAQAIYGNAEVQRSLWERGAELLTHGGTGLYADLLQGVPEPVAPVFGGIGLAQGGQQIGEGAHKVAEDDWPGGALDVVEGLAGGFAGGLAAFQGAGSLMSWFGTELTAAYLAGDAVTSGVGLASMGGRLASAAGAGATTVAGAGLLPILGAGGAGLAGGLALAGRGQDYIAQTGLLGQEDDGRGKDWSAWAGDVASAQREAMTEATGSELLGTAHGAMSLAGLTYAGAAGAAVSGVAGLATDSYEFARGLLGEE
jgi:hypothetical protein